MRPCKAHTYIKNKKNKKIKKKNTNFKESSGNCELNKHEFSTADDDTKLTDNPGTTFLMFLKVRKVPNFHCLDNKSVRVQTSLISLCKKTRLLHPG